MLIANELMVYQVAWRLDPIMMSGSGTLRKGLDLLVCWGEDPLLNPDGITGRDHREDRRRVCPLHLAAS